MHGSHRCQIGNVVSSVSFTTWKRTRLPYRGIVPGMATKRKGAPELHYYIKEHMEAKGLSGDKVAELMGLSSRSAVWKWDNEQHRLTPEKVLRAAAALDMHPNELLFPPGVPSLDAVAADATPEQRQLAFDLVKRIMAPKQ